MTAPVLVIIVIAAVIVMALVTRLSNRASVPGRLAREQVAGTGHGPPSTTLADTGRPADAGAGAEDQFAAAGDAAPAPPPPPAPVPPRLPVDPDAPGRSVDDDQSAEAVEPNEPA